jgi:hypothetical protein
MPLVFSNHLRRICERFSLQSTSGSAPEKIQWHTELG